MNLLEAAQQALEALGKLPIAYPYHKEQKTECRRAVCHQGADGYCAKCHEGMYP